MEHMTPLDAAFLDAEDEEPDISMAIASISIFEGACPSLAEITELITGVLPRVPRYRQVVRRLPFDLNTPIWIDDQHFDLGHHLQHTALPAPGGDAELRHLMARVMSQRLSRERPLWEVWLVEGLAGGRWAMINKIHHCMVDGISGIGLLTEMLSTSPAALPSPTAVDWAPRPDPSRQAVVLDAVRTLAAEPVQWGRVFGHAVRTPRASLARLADTTRGTAALSLNLLPAHGSSLFGTAGRARRYRWAKASMDDVATVRAAFGGTVNDVLLAVVSGAFRALLLSRGERCDPRTVRTLVPVSVRTPDEKGALANRVSVMLPYLPVEAANPVARLHLVRCRMARLKASKEAVAGEVLASIATMEPSPFVGAAVRTAFRLPQRSVVTVTTNVPGPRQRLYALGRPLVELLPYVPIASRLRLGVAILSYAGAIRFGITGDFDSAEDIDVFTTKLERSMEELVAAAKSLTNVPLPRQPDKPRPISSHAVQSS
jgi:diacylglycerol O-acyltransferase